MASFLFSCLKKRLFYPIETNICFLWEREKICSAIILIIHWTLNWIEEVVLFTEKLMSLDQIQALASSSLKDIDDNDEMDDVDDIDEEDLLVCGNLIHY